MEQQVLKRSEKQISLLIDYIKRIQIPHVDTEVTSLKNMTSVGLGFSLF